MHVGLPHGDAHAAQILALRTDAEAFLQTANVERLDPRARERRFDRPMVA
jgi:hypothetical protein